MATTGVQGARRGSAHRVPRWLREVLLVGILYGCYELSRGLQNGSESIATRNGWDILRWERAVHLAPEQLLTHALIGITPLCVAAAYFYSTMHYIITPLVLIWMYRSHARQYRTARTALALTTIVGLVVFYLLPTAPPRLIARAKIPDALYDVRHWGWWGGEGSVPRGLGGLTNQFAAMPSLHVGWALWCGFLLVRYAARTWVRVLGVLYPLVTTVVVLSTGNHYLLDAIAGAAVTVAGTALALLVRAETRRLRATIAGRSVPAVPTVPTEPAGRTTVAPAQLSSSYVPVAEQQPAEHLDGRGSSRPEPAAASQR